MAVTVTPLATRLQLQLNVGMDEEFNPIYRTRSFSNVKSDANNSDLMGLAQELGALQVHTLYAVRRVDEVELEEA